MSDNRNVLKINVGPQHPSTHGVLRLVVESDGEVIRNVEPVIGYLHRGMEKAAESRTYLQYLPMVDRIDYLSGFLCQEVFCSAVEQLAEIQVPERAQYIRVMLCELNRIASHLLWLGTFLLDLGATSPLFYTFRERHLILSIFEHLTGQRMMYNFHVFGGVKRDIDDKTVSDIKDFLAILPMRLTEYENIITENPIFLQRTKGLGILPKNTALAYSITGANLRASGINLDCRKASPYLVYDKTDFDIPTSSDGDSHARYTVRIEEMRQSARIIKQCLSYLSLNPGEFKNPSVKPAVIKPKEGTVVSKIESSRGLMTCTIVSTGIDKPLRVKWRTPSFYSVQLLPVLLENRYFADIMAIFGSLDVILPEVDR